ncbi:MAG: Fur family transcriptional regulator [Bacillota bacterium]
MSELPIKKVKNLFSKAGYHFTEQRSFICQELWKSRKHYFTKKEIFEYLKKRTDKISLATVYRAIDSLENLGILRKAIIKNRVIKYKVCFDLGEEVHGHLICKNCNEIIKLESKNLKNLIAEVQADYNFEIDNQIINFNGCCKKCQQKI